MTMPARNNIPVATDNEGYLLDPEQRNEPLALQIAGMRKSLKLLLDL